MLKKTMVPRLPNDVITNALLQTVFFLAILPTGDFAHWVYNTTRKLVGG